MSRFSGSAAGVVFDAEPLSELEKAVAAAAAGDPVRAELLAELSLGAGAAPAAKAKGEPCKPGETAAKDGCVPKQPAAKQPAADQPAAALQLKVTERRAFTGEPKKLRKRLTKQETGRRGEEVALAWLKQVAGKADARPMNSARANFAVDLLEDHAPTEVKAGLASNSKGAQQWRLTFSQESAAERAKYAKMSQEERAAWNADKQRRIHERKRAVIAQLEKETGVKIKPRTLCVILDPDAGVADIYAFDGFHDRIGWTSEEAKRAYQGSVEWQS